MRRWLGTWLVFAGLANCSLAAQSALPVLAPFAFLSGHWVSEDADGVSEEYWSKAVGGSMVGTFRVVAQDKAVLYEFWAIEVDAGRPVFRMKHFNRGLVAWEEKAQVVELEVTDAGPDRVMFARPDGSLSLRYVRTGSTLVSTVHHVREGKPEDDVFTLRLVK